MISPKALIKRGARQLGYHIGRWPPERSLAEHIGELFRLLPIDCVFDVGAHRGEYGAFLRELGYADEIFSLEPVRESFAALDARSARDPKWTCFPLALGDAEGTLPFNVTHATNFSSFLSPNAYCFDAFGERGRVERSELVAVRRLETLFKDLLTRVAEPRAFLKLDTRGYDARVIEGLGSQLERVEALQTEVSVRPIYDGMPGYTEVIQRLIGAGFDLSGLFCVSRDAGLRVVEFDCVMVRGSTS